MTAVTITTDGSCYPNDGTGNGGWAAIIREAGVEPRYLSGGLPRPCTNNRAELTAVLMGLRALVAPRSVTIRTDSQYTMNSLTIWREGWMERGWRTSQGEPVKNRELIEAVSDEMAKHTIRIVWVRGHATDEDNLRCDEMAAVARKALTR